MWIGCGGAGRWCWYRLISFLNWHTNKNIAKFINIIGDSAEINQNPGYMKENFMICIESLHIADTGEQENVRYVEQY